MFTKWLPFSALVFKMKHKALNAVIAAGAFSRVAPLDMGRFVKKTSATHLVEDQNLQIFKPS